MTEIYDGRSFAWINAWQCIETAQKTRNEVFEAEVKRESETGDRPDLYFSQRSTLYNALMREAEVFVGLAHAPTDVGVYAGTFIREMERRREKSDAEDAEFIERVMERDRCADCGTKLTSDNRSQVLAADGESVVYVCRQHYDERTKGGDDA